MWYETCYFHCNTNYSIVALSKEKSSAAHDIHVVLGDKMRQIYKEFKSPFGGKHWQEQKAWWPRVVAN